LLLRWKGIRRYSGIALSLSLRFNWNQRDIDFHQEQILKSNFIAMKALATCQVPVPLTLHSTGTIYTINSLLGLYRR
jgi:aminoglycoside phosphotransferase (APT) family kinase protein